MKIVAKKDRKLLLINTGNTQNENKAETIELTVPEEYEDYNKKIVFVTDDGIVWDIIQDNTYKLTKAITKYKQVDFYIWLTKGDVDFRSKTMPLRFYNNEDASDEITEEEIHGVNTVVNLLEEEITKVDSLETELRALITDIQNKLDNGEFDGEDGYTPQKGIDYFTQEDIEEIETDVKNDLEENVLVNYSLIAETGAKIELSINTTDYKLKAILKDKNNNIIHTSNVIDLPLETMVVNATYDNVNKAIILTLQNGTTVSISVADLVAGLQTEITSQNKLASDLVDDTNSGNKFVTTTEKQTWNGKYDKPNGGIPKTDLASTVQTSLNKADTAIQEHQDISGKEDKTNKVTSIDNTSTDTQYPSAKCVHDSQEIQDSEIEALQTENERLKATLPTTTGEGQAITLDKTAELEFKKPPLPMGNSEQVSYTGRNLFSNLNLENYTITSEGTYIESNNRLCSDYIDVTGMNDLTLGSEISTFYFGFGGIALFDENKNYITRQTSNSFQTITISTTNETKYARAFFESNLIPSQGNVEVLNINKIQLLNGTYTIDNLPSYEPYVGVTASPNPDYPQEITNVTGDVEVKVQNKNSIEGSQDFSGNWLNTSLWETDNSTYNGLVVKKRKEAWNGLKKEIEIVAGKTYTFSCYIKSDTPRKVSIYLNQGTSTMSPNSLEINTTTNWNRYSLTFTATTSGTVPPRIENTSYSDTNYTYICGYQLEEGSTSTPYTPHKEQVLPLTLGNIELCKIGNYQDYFYKESNKWYLHKEIDKVVYDGSETGSSRYWYVQDENTYSYQITDNTIHLKESKKGICNRFIINSSGASPYLYPILQTGTSYCRFVTYNITGTISTLEEWKRWLSSNNIVFYYPLATPTDTEITDTTLISQLEEISKTLSYQGQTNITSNTIALFDVEAYQSTKLVLEEMATAIVALGGV